MTNSKTVTEDFKVTYSRGFDKVIIKYMSDDSIKFVIIEGEKYLGNNDWSITDETIKMLIDSGGSNCGEWTSEF